MQNPRAMGQTQYTRSLPLSKVPSEVALGKPLTALEIWLDAVGGERFIDDLAELSLADQYCPPLEMEWPEIICDHLEGPGGCGWVAREPLSMDGGAAANGDARSALEIAQGYAARGWAAFPLPYKSKVPNLKAWQKLSAETGIKKFNGGEHNIGINLGLSNGLTDVDLDCNEALIIAPYLLPPSAAMFGRSSKRASHRLHYTKLAETHGKSWEKFIDPNRPDNEATLLEVRFGGSTVGAQTVFPRSVHTSGEAIEWESGYDKEPEFIEGDVLLKAGRETAAACIIARYWPPEHARREARLALGGFLARCGMTEIHAELFAQAVAAGAQLDRDGIRETMRCVRDAVEAHARQPNVYGLKKLAEELQLNKKTCDLLSEWLGYNSSGEANGSTHEESLPGGGRLTLSQRAYYVNAKELIKRDYLVQSEFTLLHHQATFYGWTGTHYAEVPPERMKSKVWHFLAEARSWDSKGKVVPYHPNKISVANTIEALAAHGQLHGRIKFPYWEGIEPVPALEILSCKNGLLHMPTRRLLAHTPLLRNTYALDYDFDPEAADPPQWLAFLSELWPNDKEAIETLQEMFGYCLTCDTSHQKIFLLIGPRRSGKGTIARVLRAMLNEVNVAGPTLASLGESFGLQPLINKPLAIISDARIGGKTDVQANSERLLTISGEDAVDVARKNIGVPWTGKLPTRFLILTNVLPRVTDASGALTSRFVIIRLTESFYGKEDLIGLDRLRTRGHFKMPQTSEDILQAFESLSNPIGVFLEDRCTVAPGQRVKCADLFLAWETWCKAQGRAYVGNVQMCRALVLIFMRRYRG